MAEDWVFTHNILSYSKKWKERARKMPGVVQDILQTVANYMIRETKSRFDRQVSPDGVPWKSLSPLTKKARKKGRGTVSTGYKAMLDTGAGKRSIGSQFVSKEEVKVGPMAAFNVFYLKYHQSGFQSTITQKQAWWMVFNLYGFNPKKPHEFIDTEEESKKRAGFLGWKVATALARKLKGSTLTVPARPFAGINRQNISEMRKIVIREIKRAWRLKGTA